MASKQKAKVIKTSGDKEHPNMTKDARVDAFNLAVELNGKGYLAGYPDDGMKIFLEPAQGNRIMAADLLVLANSYGYAFNNKCELFETSKGFGLFKVVVLLERISK